MPRTKFDFHMARTATSIFTRTIGVLFLRVLLGLMFFLQGYAKIFWWKVGQAYEPAFKNLASKFPSQLVWAVGYTTSLLELIGGAMVILGIWRNRWLFVMAGIITTAAIGHSIETGVYDLAHVFPKAMIIALLLILPDEWDEFDVKHFIAWLKRRKNKSS